ncbi:MAG: hypothetical protein C0606_04130 [Hyphomicrobiales bacterium]|nr:MAG: hypothetical protein C0606_04130 [Hyphomicrobiales bacterium]
MCIACRFAAVAAVAGLVFSATLVRAEEMPAEETMVETTVDNVVDSSLPVASRYTMTPTEKGILRLDTVTGEISYCRERDDDWVCTLAADDRAAYEAEVGRLMEENEALTDKVATLEEQLAAAGGAPTRLSEVPLSETEEKELERVLGVTEKAMRGFIGLAKTLKEEFREDEAKQPE